MSAVRQAGVRLWAKACKSEEGRAVSLSAGSSRWLGRPKGPTVVTGSSVRLAKQHHPIGAKTRRQTRSLARRGGLRRPRSGPVGRALIRVDLAIS
ncbi:unnamed protein product [Rangifer tarandus platyrhynchus]|uniref:Uncharacterized protein n=1 Tax=Rangifer tarandus platyrhynchus TaxID=3082113 RepID=A0AC59Z1D6_RANTA